MKTRNIKAVRSRRPKKPSANEVAEAQAILDELVADGVAYKGADGRYRLRENLTVTTMPDGTVLAKGGVTQ